MDRVVLYTLVLVAFILLAVISYNNMMAKHEQAKGPRKDEEEAKADWLSKFVVHDGNVVGETVAVDGDRLILKQAGEFKAVAKAQAKLHGDEIHLSGAVDWDAAITAGTAWKAENTKGRDDAVTSQLTRSEDVRAPALEAMRQREEDHEPTPQGDDSEE